MRLIDADLLVKIFVKAHCFDCAEGNQKKFNACRNSEIKPLCESVSFKYLIDSLPTIDAVEVVRCKDCKFKQKCPTKIFGEHSDDWFCADGEMRE